MEGRKLGYTIYRGTICNTGYPMDEHEAMVAIWDYDPGVYHLYGWEQKDDAVFERSMYESERDAGMLASDDFEDFHRDWVNEEWMPEGSYVIEKNQIRDVIFQGGVRP